MYIEIKGKEILKKILGDTMNTFMAELKNVNNFGYTENGAIKRNSTLNGLIDLFALGGAYRNRSDEDCITLFDAAFKEDEVHALRCLFYLRDIRGGQGERRFFRVVAEWLATKHTDVMRRNMEFIPIMGRWDDLYIFVGTPLEKDAFNIMKHQLALDVSCKTPSLLAKWLKSENTSSKESRRLAVITRNHFGMTAKQYRKTLSTLRERIRVLERLMSQGRFDEIEFDKIPSRAGVIYCNAFARRDMIKAKYETFAKDTETKVNASTLYPHDIAHRAFEAQYKELDNPDRLMLQKYWENLPNYYGDNIENGIAVVDVSGSMCGTPMEAAVSMGAYIADKAHGPFANHFITFSGNPELVKFEGVDITDKLCRCVRADWGMNTNVEAVFDMLLNTAMKQNVKPEDMPNRVYIFSDMEFDKCITSGPVNTNYWNGGGRLVGSNGINTLFESMKAKWARYGYKMPDCVFWNLNARNQNIPAIGEGFSYVSGFSPVMIQQILSGKDGLDLILEKLDSERYAQIH